MDWNDNPEQAAFRSEVRTLLAKKLPERYRTPGGNWAADRRSQDPEERQAAEDWTDALAERKWFAPHWPEEYGGAGLTIWAQTILREEMATAHAPAVGGPGVVQYPDDLRVGNETEARLPAAMVSGNCDALGLSSRGAGPTRSLQTAVATARRWTTVRRSGPEAPRRLPWGRAHRPRRAHTAGSARC